MTEPNKPWTREDILAIPAGRELDALVADKVMNMCVLDHVQGYGDGCVLSDKGMDEWELHPMFGKMEDPELLSPYSTDISAAWEVADRFWSFELRKGPDGQWWIFRIIDEDGERKANVSTSSAPEAICRAALLAVMGL